MIVWGLYYFIAKHEGFLTHNCLIATVTQAIELPAINGSIIHARPKRPLIDLRRISHSDAIPLTCIKFKLI